MKELVLDSINIEEFELERSDFTSLDHRTVVLTKWNWPYDKAWAFQKASVKLVQETPNLRILICCNHPEVLTNGRGLQKPRRGETFSLIDFSPKDYPNLPLPLFQIERGGGLTFHHPDQFIFYPIIKLNPTSLSLSSMVDQIFDFSIDVLKNWDVTNLSHENKLLGLWHEDKKIASLGIAIEKLTTFHGMALNLKENKNILNVMRTLNPCGLTINNYTSVDKLTKLPENYLEDFKDQFLRRIQHEWK